MCNRNRIGCREWRPRDQRLVFNNVRIETETYFFHRFDIFQLQPGRPFIWKENNSIFDKKFLDEIHWTFWKTVSSSRRKRFVRLLGIV